MMLVTIAAHQPNFLPWLGFFDKVRKADRFIYMDAVFLTRKSTTHRVKILAPEGPKWLSLPVRHTGSEELRIVDAELADDPRTFQKLVNLLRQSYGSTPGWKAHGEEVVERLRKPGRSMVDLNLDLIGILAGALDISLDHCVRQSELKSTGSKSVLLAGLVGQLGGTEYLSGGFPQGHEYSAGTAADYNDDDLFLRNGITIRYQCFSPPTYRQGGDNFAPGLSALDAIMWLGADQAQCLLGTT